MAEDHHATGLWLAALILGAWLILHICGVFLVELVNFPWWATIAMIAALCWLSVGLFIIAHDAMHGSLAPAHPRASRWIGRVSLLLYAGFSFDRLLPKHMAHHRSPGTPDDPDFHPVAPTNAVRWYVAFFRRYFGLRELAALTVLVIFYLLVLRADFANLMLFWALPSILSSLQLFFFGTFLPHRTTAPFTDHHRARSSGFGWWASLLSCYHFGYHHEHHLSPHIPWWRLPHARREV